MIRWLSGEWLLHNRANGGTIVMLRAVWIAQLCYLAGIVLSEAVRPGTLWEFSLEALRNAAVSNWPVAVGSFAAAYTALYARFASQWAYLAGVYNQIMAAKVRGIQQTDVDVVRALQYWEAGFIEDAEELHLATKPMFAGVVMSFLEDPGVRQKYIDTTAGGLPRLLDLERRVKIAFKKAADRYPKAPERDTASLPATGDQETG